MPLPIFPNPGEPLAGQEVYWEPGPGESMDGLERRLREWWVRTGRWPPLRVRPRERVVLFPCECGSGTPVRLNSRCGRCFYPLSRQERRFSYDLVAGYTYTEIAARHSKTPEQVDNVFRRACQKIGVHYSRDGLVQALIHEPYGHDDGGTGRHDDGSATNTPMPCLA